jgi:GNAT superfamily N-acetyltransferase
MRSCPDTYYPLAIFSAQDRSKMIAVGTIFMERKFIHGLCLYGHIEDIAVSKEVQGKGLGKKLILSLLALSESLGAYKTILDCSKDNIRGLLSLCLSCFGDSLRVDSLLPKVWVRRLLACAHSGPQSGCSFTQKEYEMVTRQLHRFPSD